MNIPRPEHPNPIFERTTWQNLNGKWDFEFDFSKSSIDREVYKQDSLQSKINVPFCPESELSGINYKDFISAVCYMKKIEISEQELKGRKISARNMWAKGLSQSSVQW